MPEEVENVRTSLCEAGAENKFSKATVGRMSLYLRCLESLLEEDRKTVSSSNLGESIGVNDAQVRKDLAALGNLGHPGVGYNVGELIAAIRSALGIDREWRAALVGVGNLARALLGYQGFLQRGFRIVALFDANPALVGQRLNNRTIHASTEMAKLIESEEIELGILTVPAEHSQNVANALISAGIRGILNFAPGLVRTPTHIPIVSVDVSVQLEQLSFLVQQQRPEKKDAQSDTR